MNEVQKSNLDKSTVKDKERGIANAVNVIFVRKNPKTGNLQIAIHKRIAPNKAGYNQWAIPGGTQEAGETLEETAIREMTEEVGVKPVKIEFNNMFQAITEVETEKGIKLLHFNHFAYVCTKWQGKFKNTEPEKHTDLVWCDIEELPINDFFISKGNIINFVNGVSYSEQANSINRLVKKNEKSM